MDKIEDIEYIEDMIKLDEELLDALYKRKDLEDSSETRNRVVNEREYNKKYCYIIEIEKELNDYRIKLESMKTK
jgi:hypothetical protein